jgi:peptidoglycan hydrolase-like protein with peptidoglycan-binding domain
MTRRRKKTEDKTDMKYYVKDGRSRSTVLDIQQAQARNRLKRKGTVLTKPWKNRHGVVVDLDPVPPPFTRAAVRDNQFGDGSGRRVGCTVPSPEIRRVRNRRRGRAAKIARKAQR